MNWLRGVGKAIVSTLALAAGVAQAQDAPSAKIWPAEWARYGESAGTAIAGWLNSDEPAAMRVQALLEPAPEAVPAATPTIRAQIRVVLRVWIDAAGEIARVEIADAPDSALPAAVTTLLAGRSLGLAPAGMSQPLRLALALKAVDPNVEPAAQP